MAEITLLRGEVCVVDDDDAPMLATRQWRAMYRRHSDGRRLPIGVVSGGGWTGAVSMHRLLMNAAAGVFVDHIDGNPLNNCRSNLRLATHDENMRNRRKAVSNKSGYKGVYLEKGRGCYVAQITSHGKKIVIGRYSSAESAHAAYCAKAAELHGDFARFQ